MHVMVRLGVYDEYSILSFFRCTSDNNAEIVRCLNSVQAFTALQVIWDLLTKYAAKQQYNLQQQTFYAQAFSLSACKCLTFMSC